jgi:hypothetical protein
MMLLATTTVVLATMAASFATGLKEYQRYSQGRRKEQFAFLTARGLLLGYI